MPPNRGAKNNNDSTNELAELRTEIAEGPPGSGYSTPGAVVTAVTGNVPALASLSEAIGGTLRTTVTLTSAWILAHSDGDADFTLVAGVPGKVIVPLGITAKLIFGTTPYGGAPDDTDILVGHGISDPSIIDIIPDDFWGESADAAVFCSSGGHGTHGTTALGAPLVLALLGGGLTLGDSDVDVTVIYTLV